MFCTIDKNSVYGWIMQPYFSNRIFNFPYHLLLNGLRDMLVNVLCLEILLMDEIQQNRLYMVIESKFFLEKKLMKRGLRSLKIWILTTNSNTS